ncbi:PPPDE putative peptidase domain-containing protein [Gigaspora rosea]|uniref:PPPDE putative peptidase domain-containing protein n=1 Tax=Gigaspora rosea TaxID=44941 RepID=A0A397U2M9_9GLOM|nr:PPPDE putative peptidase domain-containing protein [Gigaspora rosea]
MFGIGVFHSGVEVYDKEYNFGGHDFDSTGVFVMRPRIGPPNVTFKESVFMGHTSLSKEEVKNVIEELSREWSGNSYNLLTRNCNHFTSDLCNILVGKPAPNWINRAAKLGTLFPCVVPNDWIEAPEGTDGANGLIITNNTVINEESSDS